MSSGDRSVQISASPSPDSNVSGPISSDAFTGRDAAPLLMLDDQEGEPGVVILTCANCGAAMDERKCKLICLSAACTAFLVLGRTGDQVA